MPASASRLFPPLSETESDRKRQRDPARERRRETGLAELFERDPGHGVKQQRRKGEVHGEQVQALRGGPIQKPALAADVARQDQGEDRQCGVHHGLHKVDLRTARRVPRPRESARPKAFAARRQLRLWSARLAPLL
jgi:hypothetical protein